MKKTLKAERSVKEMHARVSMQAKAQSTFYS